MVAAKQTEIRSNPFKNALRRPGVFQYKHDHVMASSGDLKAICANAPGFVLVGNNKPRTMADPAEADHTSSGISECASGVTSRHDHIVPESGQPVMSQLQNEDITRGSKKSLSFYLSFLALNVTVFIVSLDLTALAVAVPVRSI